MRRHYKRHWCGPSCHGFPSIEEEVVMLEKAKEYLDSQLAIVNERLEKLKE